jgi:hypothetical protein
MILLRSQIRIKSSEIPSMKVRVQRYIAQDFIPVICRLHEKEEFLAIYFNISFQ